MAQEHRFFLSLTGESLGSTCELTLEDSHHARKVLRLSAGDPVVVVDRATGRVFEGTLCASGDHEPITVSLNSERPSIPQQTLPATILFGLCKGDHNDEVVEKATELGAERIVLWQAEHSVVQLKDPKDHQKKLERAQKIAESASKQSKRHILPAIHVAIGIKEALACLSAETTLLTCSLSPHARPLSEISAPQGHYCFIVGPEGDLAPSELQTLAERGATAISLGHLTLRSETAALVCLAQASALWHA